MKINIKATNIGLTNDIAAYLEKKVNSLEKFISEPMDSVLCNAEIGKTTLHHKTGSVFRAELNIHIGGTSLRAVSEQDNLNAAIDEARDEMAQSLTNHRSKKTTLARRGAAKIKKLLKGLRW